MSTQFLTEAQRRQPAANKNILVYFLQRQLWETVNSSLRCMRSIGIMKLVGSNGIFLTCPETDRFEPQLEHLIYCMRFVVDVLSLSWRMLGQCQGLILAHPLQFLTQQKPMLWRCVASDDDSVWSELQVNGLKFIFFSHSSLLEESVGP
jgi:hypothetical protein